MLSIVSECILSQSFGTDQGFRLISVSFEAVFLEEFQIVTADHGLGCLFPYTGEVIRTSIYVAADVGSRTTLILVVQCSVSCLHTVPRLASWIRQSYGIILWLGTQGPDLEKLEPSEFIIDHQMKDELEATGNQRVVEVRVEVTRGNIQMVSERAPPTCPDFYIVDSPGSKSPRGHATRARACFCVSCTCMKRFSSPTLRFAESVLSSAARCTSVKCRWYMREASSMFNRKVTQAVRGSTFLFQGDAHLCCILHLINHTELACRCAHVLRIKHYRVDERRVPMPPSFASGCRGHRQELRKELRRRFKYPGSFLSQAV